MGMAFPLEKWKGNSGPPRSPSIRPLFMMLVHQTRYNTTEELNVRLKTYYHTGNSHLKNLWDHDPRDPSNT